MGGFQLKAYSTMISKVIIFLLMATIVFFLFQGAYYMTKGKSDKQGTVKSLSWRIGLSIFLFILLLILSYFGVIDFHTPREILPQNPG